MVAFVTAPAGIDAVLGAHPAAVPEAVGLGATLGVADGVTEADGVDAGCVELDDGDGDGEGIRKQPLSIKAAPQTTAANSATGTSRCDMSQS